MKAHWWNHPRCSHKHCASAILTPSVVIPLSYTVAMLVLLVPFLNSIGLSINSSFSTSGFDFTILSGVYGLVFVLSGVINSFLKHENIVECIVSAAGFPGILVSIVMASNNIAFRAASAS